MAEISDMLPVMKTATVAAKKAPTILEDNSAGAISGATLRVKPRCAEKADAPQTRKLFVPIYRFCKSTGQNGRILPNSILHPAIEAVTGIKLGHTRLPLAPSTEEDMAVSLGILKGIGKL